MAATRLIISMQHAHRGNLSHSVIHYETNPNIDNLSLNLKQHKAQGACESHKNNAHC